MRAWIGLIGCLFVLSLCFAPGTTLLAQRGPGGGGPGGGGKVPGGGGKGGPLPGQPGANGKGNWGKNAAKAVLPQLEIEDVKVEGSYEVAEIFAAGSDQPRIGVTDDYCYRLAGYTPDGHALKFAFYDFKTQQLRTSYVKLPKECPAFEDAPRMAYDSGSWCVVSSQALTVFVEPKTGKCKFAAGYDKSAPVKSAKPREEKGFGRDKGKDADRAPAATPTYTVHGGAGGKYALSVLTKYDATTKTWASADATLHSAEGKSVTLKWSHSQFGVPPKDRDAVFAVTDKEVIVLVTRPRSPGANSGPCEIGCLVFDAAKGDLKEAQVSPDEWSSTYVARFALSSCGNFVLTHPMDTIDRAIVKRGTWERVYKTQYHDALVGFAPEGGIGVFLENKSPQRAWLKAIDLNTMKEVWATTIMHDDAMGDGDKEPFYAVGAGARTVAARFGIIAGKTSDEAEFIYRANAIEFVPLAMAYDAAGKRVAVLTLDRVIVIDAKTREELTNIPLTRMNKGVLGEFVAFNDKGDKIMACVRNQGAWLMDVATAKVTASLPPIKGTWCRPMPDFSAVVYSQDKAEGGNVLAQPFAGGEPRQVFRCGYKDSIAVCLWIGEKSNEFLVTERNVGEGSLQLIDDKGKVLVKYDVADVDPMYVGDTCVTAFVTKRREAVLINEVNKWEYTGVNCTMISPQPGECIMENFSFVFKTENLPGSSTYGTTAAAPFFGVQHWGDEASCAFACPAGVLSVGVQKRAIKLYAWSRQPKGLAAINPKQKEFFVAGNAGLTTFKFK
ncbi:MAG: hypothetical protein HS108_10065 [Planctomycetes bacterium]|nr:hypothetical protein [Planctomycetota bacterium]MCL4730126.1 hypothetical protein [Planctomycetota bacterium]